MVKDSGTGKGSSPFRLGVLVSGFGSNLRSIIDKLHRGPANIEIALVVSENNKAYGLTRAAEALNAALAVRTCPAAPTLTPNSRAITLSAEMVNVAAIWAGSALLFAIRHVTPSIPRPCSV